MKKRIFMIAALLFALCLLLAGCGANEETDNSNTCTVTFDAQGGTEIAAQKVQKGDRIEEPPTPEKAGYTFAGWTYRDEPWSFADYVVSEDMTLTAEWTPVRYTITYDDASVGNNPTSFTVGSDDITLAAPTRTGWTFIGWTWEGQTEPQMTVTIPKGTHENQTFRANWTFDGFAVSNGGVLTIRSDVERIPADIEIPAICNGIAVTIIGGHAFENCAGLTSVTMPDSVTSIGSSAFSGCTGLTNITIPDSVRSIGGHAFEDCAGLTSITIPNSVTSIGDAAFRDCYKLVEVYNRSALNITKGSTDNGYVGYYTKAIYTAPYVSKLSTDENGYILYTDGETKSLIGYVGTDTVLTLPNGITEINLCAFNGRTGLTSVTIPDSVTSIGGGAFERCTGLTSVTIPDSVTSIGGGAFERCTGLTSITIPNSVTSIGYSAFYGCTGLTSVTIGNGVTIIDGSAFYGCTGLTAVYITDVAKWCGTAFYYMESDGGANPLKYAHNLYVNGVLATELVIPDSVTRIGNYAFYYCTGLTSVTIPDSVRSIGSSAFSGCTGLTIINFTGTKAQWDAISKERLWDYQIDSYIIYCTDGDIAK